MPDAKYDEIPDAKCAAERTANHPVSGIRRDSYLFSSSSSKFWHCCYSFSPLIPFLLSSLLLILSPLLKIDPPMGFQRKNRQTKTESQCPHKFNLSCARETYSVKYNPLSLSLFWFLFFFSLSFLFFGFSTVADRLFFYFIPFQIVIFVNFRNLFDENKIKILYDLLIITFSILILLFWLKFSTFSVTNWQPFQFHDFFYNPDIEYQSTSH